MPDQSTHPVMCPVVRNDQRFANGPTQQPCGPAGNSELPPARRRVSVPAGKRYYSQGRSSVASTIEGQNSTPLSWLNNSRIADITQYVSSSPSATQRRSILTPTATPGTSSHHTPAPSRSKQTESMRRVVSSPASVIASNPTPLSCLEYLPTPIPNSEARAIMACPMRTRATERNRRERQWQMQLQVVSTPRSVVSGSRSIHRFGHSNMTSLVFVKGRILELYMWKRVLFISACDLERVSCATRRVAKSLAEDPHWYIIETYWNTAMKQNNIWSIAFEGHTEEILNVVC